MGLEDDLTGMLAESVHELSPPVSVMVAEGKRAGRRRLKIRRSLQAVGAAAVVAALVSTVAVLGPRPGGSDTVQAAGPATGAGTGSSAPASVPSAGGAGKGGSSASPSPSPSAPAEPATANLSWQAMLKILSDLLPPGAHLGNLDPFAVKFRTGADARYIELQYNDGHGASTVMVEVSRGGRPSPVTCENWGGGSDEGTRKPGYEKPVCLFEQLPDGGTLRSFVTGTDVAGLYDEMVHLVRPDGVTVSVTAANATLDQYTGQGGLPITVTRDRPPLGLAGWKDVARSPKWQFKVPQSVADAGVAFARTVSRFPCPKDAKKADCVID
ncbi:hypothetical protein BX265_5112 [Streptomyces sp. TLI_235]|nr:hypothetical protein [Streptomyces sp. TLI_235]PBC70568.1 hypothetical protein BX265_5112 [Streptomyces sp. TLI_235]